MRRSERLLYTANGADLRVVDVAQADGEHVEQPFIRTPRAAGAVTFQGGRVLLLWRHHLVTDTWGWEIPLGEIGPDEEPEAAAARHLEEQTGWRPGPLLPLIRIRPAEDVADCDHLIFLAHEASPGAAPAGAEEAEWLPVLHIQQLMDEQAITSATTSAALLYFLANLLQARAPH
ncbi:NUDIX domain-containing protein [Nonomuraea sp. NPDC050536]|uniref:NUDIX domain-containing protein n=1 Tax=Nonomuraea sp. NPDC050536 TaxID=3364366 RepID=UPI0037CB4AED